MPWDKFQVLDKISTTLPSLVAVYNIRTGQYIYVNEALELLLGYKKEKFLKEGLQFASSIVHPDDLPVIMSQNFKALREANKKQYLESRQPPVTFEYRMRHKRGNWRWLLSKGTVFARDKKGKVEYVMNVSIDITDRKSKEQIEQESRERAESEKNRYYQLQMHSMALRTKISDILRKDIPLDIILNECLTVLIQQLPAKFARLWLYDPEQNILELKTSAGKFPPNSSIRQTLQVGEYAVGLVAQKLTPYFTNNVYENNNFHIQNVAWSKKNKLKSFAGYPLIVGNKLIGVLAIFATYDLAEEILGILSYIADILAQEISRRKVEDQLNESKERYSSFLRQSSEGIWRFELEKPMPLNLSVEEQLDFFYQYAYLAECNDALAKMYGYRRGSDIVGARLGDMLIRDNEDNIAYLKGFISTNYALHAAESTEIDRHGRTKYFLNSLTGILQNGQLIRAWGIQQDITERKIAEQNVLNLSKQKDEFIAIASHELKTPITTLKAYTQILQRRLAQQDSTTTETLAKMDNQLNKITTLITDLLDVSRIEAGKIQFNTTEFCLNKLIEEIVEQMQRTTESHILKIKQQPDIMILADNDRIGQVIINLISNAIKYSPKGKVILINIRKTKHQVKVSIRDYGIGISKKEQAQVFDRFFRAQTPQKESSPGLGLGLYICSEIIKRHKGKIGVKSQKGKGATFYFTIPV